MSRFRSLRGRLWGVFDTPLRPGMCGPSKNYLVFVPFGAACGAYAIRPYNWIRVTLRNTDAMPQSGTCDPSKNHPVFVPFGDACGAYAIRPYNRVRVALQKTVPFSSPFGAACGAYSIRPYNRVRAALRKTVLFSSPSGSLGGAYAIRPYGWVHTIFRNTDAILQLGTCDPSKYRCDSPTGYVRFFEIPMRFPNRVRVPLRNTDAISRPEARGCLGGGAVGATVCGGDGRE